MIFFESETLQKLAKVSKPKFHTRKRTRRGGRRRHLTIFNVFHLFLSQHSNLHDIFYPDVDLALLFNIKPQGKNVFLVGIFIWGKGGECFSQIVGETNSITRILRQWELLFLTLPPKLWIEGLRIRMNSFVSIWVLFQGHAVRISGAVQQRTLSFRN